MRQGGDGYKLFATNAKNAYDYGPGLEQVVADYLTKNRPYTPKLDGRITEINAPVKAAAADAAAAPATTAPATTAPATTAPAADASATAQPTTPELPAGSADIANTPPTVEGAPATAGADASSVTRGAGGAKEHVVVAGDNYWDIAEQYYQDGEKWHLIREANKYRARHIPIGATLTIPAGELTTAVI